jgi:hypothetical protein
MIRRDNMKKISLMEGSEVLSKQAQKNLLEIEELLNRSYKNLKEIGHDLNAIEKSFAIPTFTQSPVNIYH